ncbi:hypothetical protein K438DRAFT_1769147 [Mycena galopus ATCC 62051]|nr:hypothetical protein K438DRAFT_1769147 [Mycena galopus ATCC 62051]
MANAQTEFLGLKKGESSSRAADEGNVAIEAKCKLDGMDDVLTSVLFGRESFTPKRPASLCPVHASMLGDLQPPNRTGPIGKPLQLFDVGSRCKDCQIEHIDDEPSIFHRSGTAVRNWILAPWARNEIYSGLWVASIMDDECKGEVVSAKLVASRKSSD